MKRFMTAGGPGFAWVGLKYFKSAPEERRGVYVTIGCYIKQKVAANYST